MDDRLDKAALR